MVEKTYFLGRFKNDSAFADNYLLGIHRQGEDTVPFPEKTTNGVKNDITTRLIGNMDKFSGYLTAVVGEYQFEGFEVGFRHWSAEADELFAPTLQEVPGFSGNIEALLPQEVDSFWNIVGLEIRD